LLWPPQGTYGFAMSAESEAATAKAKQLTVDPGKDVKLTMYALYKQATSGDVRGKRPGFTDPVGRAKYDAWSALAGTSAQDAEQQYIELVDSL
jgi:acyl-CoA-binding protein